MPSNRFDSFVEVQYRYVFAIALPYTNPHKYDHYTVSLAHHVIAGWYLKCKLPLRRNFVDYILKGFMTNVQKPFEETKRSGDFINEDSSNRKRSSSLTERGPKNRDRPALQSLSKQSTKNDETPDEMVYNFHMELAETCIDFLARHCYSMCSALPKRLPTTDFLLVGAQTKSWFIGHNIVTITTSGCSSVATKNSLCDRCSLLCKSPGCVPSNVLSPSNGSVSPEVKSSADGSSLDLSHNKRYTKASLLHNSSGQDSESTDVPSSSTSSSAAATPYPQTSLEQPSSGKFFRQTSNEHRVGGSSSSSSMEALSRRGSNPDTLETTGAGAGVASETATAFKRESTQLQSVDRSKQSCVCLCSGWAEIVIRRPTGNMSWMMRIQNQMSLDAQNSEIPLQNLISQMMPSLGAIYPNSDSWTLEPSRDHTSKASSLTEISQIQGDSTASATTAAVADNSVPPTSTTIDDVSLTSTAVEPTADEQKGAEKNRTSVPKLANLSDLPKNQNNAATTVSITDDRCANSVNQSRQSDTTSAHTAASDDKPTAAALLSGPIDIPKSSHAYKIPSGSFSDVEPEPDDEDGADVAFEENDSRSRNRVRRVNSSPEMSSNYRQPFVAQKASGVGGTQLATGNAAGATIHVTSSDDDATVAGTSSIDPDQQQKKKNFSKERVNCEAIPEEITDSTPPNQQPMAVERQHSNEDKIKLNRLTASACASMPVTRGPSATDALLPNVGQSNVLPRKQHSADDALPPRGEQTGDETSIAASSAYSSTRSLATTATDLNGPQGNPTENNGLHRSAQRTFATRNVLGTNANLPIAPYASSRRNNIAVAAAASSAAAAMGVPLSPRLLAKTGGMSLLGSANAASDFPRGRSKTISVVTRNNSDNDARLLSKWTFRGSKCAHQLDCSPRRYQ